MNNYKFFNGSNEFDPVTACVGNNGNPSIEYYANGYFEAVELIINDICRTLRNGNRVSEDTLVYPICFNIRHSIELYLKSIIYNIMEIYKHRGESINAKTNMHDLSLLWQMILKCSFINYNKENNKEISRRMVLDYKTDEYISSIDKYISEWSNIDPTGQTFRYPTDIESNKHLVEVSSIQVLNLFKNSKSIHEILKEFNSHIYILNEQYKNREGGKFLTYGMLTELAKNIGENWKVNLTKDKKYILAEKFKLSQRQLTESINEIKADRYLLSLIDAEFRFEYINANVIKDTINFFKIFEIKITSKTTELNIDTLEDRLTSYKNIAIDENNIKEFLYGYKKCEREELLSIYYISRDNLSIGGYENILDFTKKFTDKELERKFIEARGNISKTIGDFVSKYEIKIS
jgi:hypothetical protein